MSSDAGSPEAPAPKPRHDLPGVVTIEVRRVPYEPPRRRNFESSLPRPAEVVEFLVETDAPIPVRALGPVLYVGDTPVIEVVAEDPLHYRFTSLEPERLAMGAPFSLGWSGQPSQRRRLDIQFEG